MGKKVPLVVYPNGERKVIGEVEVNDDGSMVGQITDEISKVLLTSNFSVGDFGFIPTESRPVHISDLLDLAPDEFPKRGPWSRTVPRIPFPINHPKGALPIEFLVSLAQNEHNLDRDGD